MLTALKFLDRPLKLLVYNHEYNVTRPVDITPSRSWGGQGALGCTLGFGALHRVPASLEEPPSAPGETMFDTSMNEKSVLSGSPAPPMGPSEFLIPADMEFQHSSPPPGAGQPKRDRKARAHAQILPSGELDDYFKEGEEKSREMDNAPTLKAGSNVPPPPKAGALPPPPPKAAAAAEGAEDT
jgi:GRASP55/65 PDZ-like domain